MELKKMRVTTIRELEKRVNKLEIYKAEKCISDACFNREYRKLLFQYIDSLEERIMDVERNRS